jgi:DNA polymerase V
VTDQIVLTVGYDVSNKISSDAAKDRYGRSVPRHAHGTINLPNFNNSANMIMAKTGELFEKIVDSRLLIRRMYVVANHVRYEVAEKPLRQLDIFTDYEKMEADLKRDKRRQEAILKIKEKYGKNSILRGLNFEKGATMRERNKQVGGHKA